VKHEEKFTESIQLRNILSATVNFMSVRESWTDERLDDLSKKVDQGFARPLNGRFDSLQRTLFQVGGVMTAALIGLIATQV
jgi:hypothetical protein